jgi:Transposase DDE domain
MRKQVRQKEGARGERTIMKTRTKRVRQGHDRRRAQDTARHGDQGEEGPANDNKDFEPVARRAQRVKRIGVGIGDKGYDAEKNHELLRDEFHALSIIPTRHEEVPIWRTRGKYRKQMKRGYSKKTYHQRSKDETIFSVIKRTMGDEVRSVKTRGQNNEMRMKVISYNAARIVRLTHPLLRGFLQSHMMSDS